MRKKEKRRADWMPPPKSAERVAHEAEWRRRRFLRAQPPVPPWRVILGLAAMSLLTGGMFLVFLLPSDSLVSELRSRGVSVWAEVTASPKDKYGNPGIVKVKFSDAEEERETLLHDWGGMRPEGLEPGGAVSVTYDPRDPGRVLTTDWVRNPPTMTAPMPVTLLLFLLFLAGAVFGAIRRRIPLEGRKRVTAA